MSGDLEARLAEPAARAELAREVSQIAVEAGDLLDERFEKLDPATIGSKSTARDLVTEADLASERLLVERLRAAYPGTAIEAEEEVRDAAGAGLRWFLDPLDGTVNYVHGLPCFAVSVALYRDAEPLVGCVHLPRLRETFRAAAGAGAFLGERRLRVSAATEIADSVLATGFPYLRGELPNDNVGNFARIVRRVRGIRRMGSAAVDLAYTAAGRLDAFWELHLAPHDVAAGALLVREAGGLVTDLAGGSDWLRGGQVVAGPRALVEGLRARISADADRFEAADR